ncbi:MAG: DUF2298 domain-containing protein [Dehalococcoidia bacterium]
MYHAIIWLVIVELLGLVALPYAFLLLRRLPDRGYSAAKALGLLLFAYLLWLLGLTQVVPNAQLTLIGILLALAALGGWLAWRARVELLQFFARERWAILSVELVFLALYAVWLLIVSHTPAINHTEKPMDFAFLNGLLASRSFPPEDPWLAGQPMSYYYFGYLMMAALTKLSGIPSSISYNLALGLVPALAGSAAFGLVYNLVRLRGGRPGVALASGLAGPLFLLLIGNLVGVLELVRIRGWGGEAFWGWIGVKGLEGPVGAAGGWFPSESWWWWRSTRVIDIVVDGRSLDYTITEFPFFSFLLGDLHPHVTAVPFILLTLAIALNLFSSAEGSSLRWLRSRPWEVLVAALALGALGFINTWDLPTFAFLLAAVALARSYGLTGGRLWAAARHAAPGVAVVLVGAVLLYLPYYFTLNSQATGILPVREVSTRPLHFVLIWGLFLLLGVSLLVRQAFHLGRTGLLRRDVLGLTLAVCLLPFLAWLGLELLLGFFEGELAAGLKDAGTRFLKILPGLAVLGVALYSALRRAARGDGEGMGFPLLLMATAFLLLVGAELFYLSDLFGNRMNTVFKLYYQAWILLALASAYSLSYWHTQPLPGIRLLRWGGYGFSLVVALLVAASLYYPVGAVLDKTNGFDGNATLDGLAFLRQGHADEYRAIGWLREAPRGRLVEAVGGSYSEFARISASTGQPTLLGWPGHELQWRGSSVLFQDREREVEEIYRSTDVQRVEELLARYDVRYVYVGRRERQRYGQEGLAKFDDFLTLRFSSGDVVIYERVP